MRVEHWIYMVPLKLRALFYRTEVEQELDEEIRDHVDRLTEANIARGLSATDARTAALRSMGGVDQRKEECRDTRGLNTVDNLGRDLQYALRSLARTPVFTAVALGTLALGIGANTAIFSVVNGVLLRPLNYSDPNQLVVLPCANCTVAPATFLDWKATSQSFSQMGLAEYWTPNLTGSDKPEQLLGIHLTSDILPLLGIQPMLGRFFLPEEEHAGRNHVVVLSHDFWKSRFGGNRDALGQPIILDGQVYTVVGVMPPDFDFVPFWASGAMFSAPLVLDERKSDRQGSSLRAFARLGPGVTLAQARSEMRGIAARLESLYPGTNKNVTVTPLHDVVVGDARPTLLILLVAVGFVLLIACVNVAHLQLVRATAREREFAVRAALGASRGRIIQQSLTESGLLAFTGGGLGLLLAYAGVHALVALGPPGIPRLETISLDPPVFAFLLVATVVVGVAFGAVPASRVSRVPLNPALKEGARSAGEGTSKRRLRGALVASEIALALILLVGAGLILRSFVAMLAIDPGFSVRNVLSLQVSLQGTQQADPARRSPFFREVVEQVAGLPGVEAVGAINHVPLNGDDWHFPFAMEGRPYPRPGESPKAEFLVVRPGYFGTMGIPLLQGRDFVQQDEDESAHLVIINQFMARRHWPGQDPIGKRISVDDPATGPDWFTVLAVAKDVQQGNWVGSHEEQMYFPYQHSLQSAGSRMTLASFLSPVYMTLVIRTTPDAAGLTKAVEGIVHSLDRDAPVSAPITMERAIHQQLAKARFTALLLGSFAAVALVLAVVGVYGVISYTVARRTREIGIRVALGGSRNQIFQLVMKQGLRLAVTGAAFGLAAALVLSRYLRALLFQVQPTDPPTFIVVTLLLAAAAVAACWIPARSALRVDPIITLRSE